jgi:uncharacterized protein involved in exopolysaccharide biosynthesis
MQDRVASPERSASSGLPKDEHAGLYYVDYGKLLEFFSRHHKTILKSAAIGIGAGLLYLLIAAPVYTARTQLLIDPALPNVLREQSIEPTVSMDSQQVETEIAVLRSEEVSIAAIESLNLPDEPEFNVRMWSDYLPSWAISEAKRTDAEYGRTRLVLAKFRRNLSVRRIGVSHAIDIYYTAGDPELAARIANSIASSYMRFQLETRANAARAGSLWLEERLAQLRQAMNAAARRMQEHRAVQDYSIARKSASASSALSAQQGKTKEEQAEPLTFEDLESTATTYRRIYESFLQSFMASVQRQSFPISSGRIITKASSSLAQSRSAGLMLAFAAMLGALAGIGLCALRDRAAGTPSPVSGKAAASDLSPTIVGSTASS